MEGHADIPDPVDGAADTAHICHDDPSEAEAEALVQWERSHHNIQLSIEAEVGSMDKVVFPMGTVGVRLGIRRPVNCCVHVHTHAAAAEKAPDRSGTVKDL